MKFRPLHDRVVVKRIDAEDRTAGGIIIPDNRDRGVLQHYPPGSGQARIYGYMP